MDNNNTSHAHWREERTTRWYPFVNWIIEVDLPLGWKLLTLEHYDGTTDRDKYLDVFLIQANIYTNNNAILC